MTTRFRRRLAQSRIERRGVLMGFLPAGYPSVAGFAEAAGAAFDAGLDALEVGMPGPAPEMDGELIRSAALIAARNLSGIDEALSLAAECRASDDDIIVALAYADTFNQLSIDDFISGLVRHGIDALLLPQHPVPEQLAIAEKAQAKGVDSVIFLHLQQDLALLSTCRIDRPIIYLQSADLQTGGIFNPAKARERLGELREAMGSKPYSVCVGFGVRESGDVADLISSGADGVIIGTHLVAAAAVGPSRVTAIIDDVTPALRWQSEARA